MNYMLNNKYKIKYSKKFKKQIKLFLEFEILILDNYKYSSKFYIKFKKIINLIECFPEMFPIIKFKNEELRKIVIGKYIILYQINYNQKEILFLHIFYYRQNYLNP